VNHAEIVLGAIIPGRRDLLLRALAALEDEHFRDPVARGVWRVLGAYYDLVADVVSPQTFMDLLTQQGVDEAKQVLYVQAFTSYHNAAITDSEFAYGVARLREVREEQLTGETIASAFEVFTRGAEIAGEELKGPKDARSYLYRELARIDHLSQSDTAPEGDMRLEMDAVLADYADRKAGGGNALMGTSIPDLDDKIGGFSPGELDLICAYTSQGKSQFLTQIAWNASVSLGKDVYFSTSETVREQIIRRIQARHSLKPEFGCPEGIDVNHIKNGSLSPEHEKVFQAVVEDLRYNSSYGKLFISQIPRGTTMAQWELLVKRQADQWKIELLCMDYLALLRPDRARQSQREEATDILKDAKVLATTLNSGEGVPIISPWQMSQRAFNDALGSGAGYTLASLADTSEAEKSADLLISLLRRQSSDAVVDLQILKNRDGAIPEKFKVSVDYKSAYLGNYVPIADAGEMFDVF
jgi:replicative DNA helicase